MCSVQVKCYRSYNLNGSFVFEAYDDEIASLFLRSSTNALLPTTIVTNPAPNSRGSIWNNVNPIQYLTARPSNAANAANSTNALDDGV